MTTLGSRIKEVIVHQSTTMTKFAQELNISQSMVSKICADKATPSERTISDICRIYGINKDWLVNGTGEMIDIPKREAEIADYINQHAKPTTSADFKASMAFFLARMSPAEIEGLGALLDKILTEIKNDPEKFEYTRAVSDAYMEGFRTAQRIYEQYGSLPTLPNE